MCTIEVYEVDCVKSLRRRNLHHISAYFQRSLSNRVHSITESDPPYPISTTFALHSRGPLFLVISESNSRVRSLSLNMEEQFLNPLEDDSVPDDVQEKLAKVIERYQQMSDEEKEQFQQGAFDVLTKTLQKLPKNTILPTWLAPYQSYILFIFAVSIVAFLLVIVSRRLYSRAKEREQRQEEKRKLRQQKIEMKKKKKKLEKKQT